MAHGCVAAREIFDQYPGLGIVDVLEVVRQLPDPFVAWAATAR